MIYSKRVLDPVIVRAFHDSFITGILGPRRVGKSTLIEHFFKEHAGLEVVHFNMDSMDEREAIKSGQLEALILTRIRRHFTQNKCVWVTIDEAQKCPELFDQVKMLYDRYKDKGAIKFIITGSALLELHRLSAESLAGRIQLYHLSAFGLSEAHEKLFNTNLQTGLFDLIESEAGEEKWQQYFYNLTPYSHQLKETLLCLQAWGGLPEVLALDNDDARLNYLANYLQTYLEKDVRAIKTITDLPLYRQIMQIIAEQTGSVRDDDRILSVLRCHRETLNKYRRYMRATLMFDDIHPYINSSLKRLVKSPKGYLINNGLISYLQGIHDIDILIKTGQIGHRFENWFLNELMIWLNKTAGNHEIFYWRTSGGAEVDFVVKKAPHVYPFEITFGKNIEQRKVRNLMRFRESEPKVGFSFYIYMGEFKYDANKKIIFIPAWAVC